MTIYREFMAAIQFPENRKKINEKVEGLIKQWEHEDREYRRIYNELSVMFEEEEE